MAAGTIENGQATVGTTAVRLVAGASLRKGLLVQNLGSGDVYVGPTGVTTATGIKVPSGGSVPIDEFVGDLYAIGSAAGQDVRWMGTR